MDRSKWRITAWWTCYKKRKCVRQGMRTVPFDLDGTAVELLMQGTRPLRPDLLVKKDSSMLAAVFGYLAGRWELHKCTYKTIQESCKWQMMALQDCWTLHNYVPYWVTLLVEKQCALALLRFCSFVCKPTVAFLLHKPPWLCKPKWLPFSPCMPTWLFQPKWLALSQCKPMQAYMALQAFMAILAQPSLCGFPYCTPPCGYWNARFIDHLSSLHDYLIFTSQNGQAIASCLFANQLASTCLFLLCKPMWLLDDHCKSPTSNGYCIATCYVFSLLFARLNGYPM